VCALGLTTILIGVENILRTVDKRRLKIHVMTAVSCDIEFGKTLARRDDSDLARFGHVGRTSLSLFLYAIITIDRTNSTVRESCRDPGIASILDMCALLFLIHTHKTSSYDHSRLRARPLGCPLPMRDSLRSSLRLSDGGVSLFWLALIGSAFSVGVTPDPYWLAYT
jgi:hypothetical protein